MNRQTIATKAILLGILGLLVMPGLVAAAEPPALLNYQGVLRDAADAPIDGTRDMIFTFYSAESGGDEILIDQHTAAGGNPITVTEGLFSASLGGGVLADGVGPGTYNDLAAVFRDYAEVWLRIDVEGETLAPRIRVLAAGYALNADHLDGADRSFFLDTSGATQEKPGLLIASGGIDYGPGASDDLKAADVETLTSGAVADPLHTHSNVGASTLDGLDSPQFLRSDTSDAFTHGDFSFEKGTELTVRGSLSTDGGFYMNKDGPEGDQWIYFYDSGSPTRHWLLWDDDQDRFQISGLLFSEQEMRARRFADCSSSEYYVEPADVSRIDELHVLGHRVHFRADDPDGDFTLYFADDGFWRDEWIRWSDLDDQFEFSNDLSIAQELRVGTDTTDDRIIFNGIERLEWDDSQARFEFSDHLAVTDTLSVGSSSSESESYSWFGSPGPPISGDISTDGDLYVRYDVEAGSNMYVGTSIIVGDPYPAASQPFSSIGDASYKEAPTVNDASDLFVQGVLEVGRELYANTRFGENMYDFSDRHLTHRIDDDDNSSIDKAYWYHDGNLNPSNKIAELQEDGDLRIRGTLSENVSFDIAESFYASEPLEPGDLVAVAPDDPVAVVKTSGEADRTVIGVVSSAPGVLLGSAPFDSTTLRDVWGDETADLFADEVDRLKAELLGAHQSLRDEKAELVALEDRVLEQRRALADGPLAGTPTPPAKVGPPALTYGEQAGLESAGPLPDPASSVEELETLLDRTRTAFESELHGLALERFFERHFVPVALAGRIPIKVDASYGAIAPGDPLSPSPTPGVAMRAVGGGPVVGTALEPLPSGSGKILAMVTRSDLGSGEQIAAVAEQQQEMAAELDERTPDRVTGVQALPGHLQVVLDRDGDDQARFSIFRDGQEGLGDEVFRVDEDGNLFTKGAVSPASMDVAEMFPVIEPVTAGHVLVASREIEGRYALCRDTADRAVIGVVAAAPGVLLGRSIDRIAAADDELAEQLELARRAGDREAEAALWTALEERFLSSHAAVALTGTVDVKVDAGYGSIEVGDLLTTSPTAGHAMRSDELLPGTILGKALSSLEIGTGTIRMLVTLR